MGNIRFTSRIKQWTAKTESELDLDVLQMATDIHRVAGILAPFLSGALVRSGRIERLGQGKYAVVYGGNQVPYAKRRHYENRKHPATLRYLERAGDQTSRNAKRYFKGATV